MTYKKLSKEDQPVDFKFEFDRLEDKLQFVKDRVVTRNEVGEVIRELDYYEKRKNEISFSWLNGTVPSDEQKFIWHANMPLAINVCEDIYSASMRGLPKKTVEALVFVNYELDKEEEELFDVVYNYGQAQGLMSVADELYEGAKAGDPRAVKMYLEISGLLLVTEESKESAQRKKLMRISFDM